MSASSPLSVVPSIYADMFANPVPRGRAVAIFTGVGKSNIHSLHKLTLSIGVDS